MKFINIYILTLVALIISSCKKDLGNYDYSPPSEPQVAAFKDSTFSAFIGDSLIIKPKITLADADPQKDLSYEWHISVQEELREEVVKGFPLKMIYHFGPGKRTAKLIITDNRNGLKYPIPFNLVGVTQFSTGKLVLSNDNGTTKLSFVKADNSTVLPDLYQSLNKETLPANPVEIYYAKPLPYQPNTTEEFWILCNDPNKSSVILDASTLLLRRPFTEQFFIAPSTINVGHLESIQGTVSNGVINGKLYIGTLSTAPFAPDYGKFANEQSGNYDLSKYFTQAPGYYFGFDKRSKAFVTFSAGGAYNGADYRIDTASTGFDPKNVGMDNLLYMKAGGSKSSYAFFKAADGSIQELAFSYDLAAVEKKFKAENKRVFKGASLVNDDTKWQRTSLHVYYFSSNDKIYRYNPINEEIRQLDASFGGKKVSMLKISDDDNELMVGVAGSLVTLDISVGKNGVIKQTIQNIPGAPVDVVTLKP